MKQVLRTRVFNCLTAFTVLVLLVLLMRATAYAEEQEPVTYMDWENGQLVEKTCTDYKFVDVRTIMQDGGMLDGGWYVVEGDVTFDRGEAFDGRINVINSAHLILMDGATLNAKQGIKVCVDRSGENEVVNTLTIYGQSEGTGKLNAIATDSHAAIGGNGVRDVGNTNFCDAGNVIINGGDIYAEGNLSAPGIGGGEQGKGGSVIINHGKLTAEGYAYSSGVIPAIGAGYGATDNGTVSVNEDLAVVAGDSKNDLTDVTGSYSQSHHQQYVYIGEPADHTVTYKVRHGKWDDKTTDDKTGSFRNVKGVAVKIPADEFPAVGNEPDAHYKKEGIWDPSQDTITSEDKTYTYYYSYEDDSSAIVGGTDVLGKGVNTAGAPTVMYGGNSWRVIGYKGFGVASTDENMTLLSSGHIGQTLFSQDNNNSYAVSDLKAAIDKIANALSPAEKAAVAERTLTAGNYAGSETDCIAGEPVSNALMWPLSTKEAHSVCNDLRIVDPDHPNQNNSRWWLRSPGERDVDIGMVYGNGSVDSRGFHVTVTTGGAGVRPAFNLDTDSILFTTPATGGKNSGEVGSDALAKVSKASGNSWKLTVKDSSRSGFTAKVDNTVDGAYPISYSGAKTGPNEYISAIVKDSEGNITYYGRIKNCASDDDESGNITINLKDKFSIDDKLYVFNEQYNGDNKTDYASDLRDVTVICTVIFLDGKGDDGQGNVLKTEDVIYGFAATAPEPPAPAAGYTFKGWDRDFSNIKENTVVKAEYEPIRVSSLRFRYVPSEIDEDAEDQITVSINPSDALNKTLEYISSDESVLTVSESGRVKGIKAGKATVTVRTTDGSNLKRSRTITVNHIHAWGDWEVVTAATEEAEGEESRTCAKCGETETRVIPELDHVHDLDLVEGTKATCTTSGTMDYYECSGCDAIYADENGENQISLGDLRIPATGHTAADPVKEGEETLPTCSSVGGYNLYTRCETCGFVLNVERVILPIDPEAHDWDDGVVTKEATETEAGIRTYTCREDPSHTKTEAIPKLISIKNAKVVLSASAFTYNGKVRKPSIKTIGGRKLTADTDYTVKWSNSSSKNVGKYTVTITGTGNYTGVTKATYRINPKGTSLYKPVKAKQAVTVKWKKQTARMSKSRATGYQILLATDSKFTKNKKTVNVKGYKTASKKVTKLKGGKKYYIKIRTYMTVSGTKYYSAWSKAKTVTTLK